MKILHIIPSYLPAVRYGGPMQSVHALCKSLVRLGHEVDVLTSSRDGHARTSAEPGHPTRMDGVNVWYFNTDFFRRLYHCPGMGHFLDERMTRYDLVHSHSVFLWPTWAGESAARRHHVPYVISPRGMLVQELIRKKNSWLKMAWIQWIEKGNLEAASAIHATSELEAKQILEFGLKLKEIFVVPNGIDPIPDAKPGSQPETLRALEQWTGKRPFILFLGRINWKKGLDHLILSLEHAPEALLAIVGNDEDGYQKKLQKICDDHAWGDRVRFFGPIYDASKYELYKKAACFALPSQSENFGNAVLEALAVGCPVVVTPGVGLAQDVSDAGAGCVVSGEPAELGSAINRILLDDSLRGRMGEAGKRLSEKFTWEVVSKKMADKYQTIKREFRDDR